MNITSKILVRGVDNEKLEHDLCQMITQFRENNPEKPIEKVRPILENVMSSVNERGN